jgi:hypothetical protein
MYFWLQEHEPLSRVKLPYGDEGWLLTRYDDVRAALGDPRFSLAEAAVRDVPRLTPQRYGAILTDLDPPDHQLHLRPADPPRPARPAAFASRADAGRGGGADALGAVAGDGRHAAALRARRRPAQQRHCSRWRSDPAAKHAANRDPARTRIPTASTSPVMPKASWSSGTAPTTASAPRWPGWTSRWPSPRCWPASPTCIWPLLRTSCNGRPAWPSAAQSPCRSAGEDPMNECWTLTVKPRRLPGHRPVRRSTSGSTTAGPGP